MTNQSFEQLEARIAALVAEGERLRAAQHAYIMHLMEELGHRDRTILALLGPPLVSVGRGSEEHRR